ncbi:treslin [Talpa occidentalis]|uniref:treslin n=1 Tax=Talpa occidentalis TaxID=50954 RepID=UPI0018909847|nr:treslin [Talpa occidentalis]
MAGCHDVMLLLDTAGGAAGQGPVRRAALRLLTHLGCRFGLARVRWAFRFFDSQGARSGPSRASDFRELGARAWQELEAALAARLAAGAPGAHLPGPAPRAAHTRGALLEALLDYEWDRPDISSPAKPALRRRGARLLDVEGEAAAALGGFANAVFLLAACPHSRRELLQFASGGQAQARGRRQPAAQVMDSLLPRRVQEVMIARRITLYWVDTTERARLWESPDHLGYWTVCELLHHVGGTILPSETFSQDFAKAGRTPHGRKLPHEPHLSSWLSVLPADSTLNRLLHQSPEYEASFPRVEGTLFLPVAGKESQETWAVILEPLAMQQRHFQKPVRIFLKGTVAQWSPPASSTLATDSWMLQIPEEDSVAKRGLFQQLVSRLTAEDLHLVVNVDPGEGWPPVTGVISPLSVNATILTVFRTEEAQFQGHFLHTLEAESSQDTASLFSSVLDDVLSNSHSSHEDPAASAPPVPEWAQQELRRTTRWSPAVVESWFPCSNLSGASSDLMESFWLLQAASSHKEESSAVDSEFTRCLSELYQRRSREDATVTNQEDSRKKRGVPRTPVRQKMNTMCRSLKMLNVARLNVKAQKLHPNGSPEASGEKGTLKMASGRATDRLEGRGRVLRSSKAKEFKTEEELLSYIHESYQKTVAAGEIALYPCAQNMVSTIKAFLKSTGTQGLEVNCLNQIKNNLLKTSKSLRQNIGKNLDKGEKVRECQLQVFLRLEMCLQCPSAQEHAGDAEQVVKEVADLLRIVCLTEDLAYLAGFLEEILGLYIDSIPKTLGELYDSLGLAIPQKLASVLPADFFSDDSLTQESKSPLLSEPLTSCANRSVSASTESDQLEELRTRSAKKRRKNALIRHKSIADVSQTLRQIEIPKVSKRATKTDSCHPALQQPPLPGKEAVQEMTKVRRNLFNEEMISSSKRSQKQVLPRSQSVSAVEGLQYKPDNFKKTKGYHRLLTKSVAETPVHKQMSRRLLHRQIKGRSSDPGPEIDVVEESPEKGDHELGLRRSPRIKQLSFSRTNSGSFYSVSQPKSRSVQRVHSSQDKSEQRENSPFQSIRSPKRLFFGAVSEVISPSEKGSARIKRPSRNTPGSDRPTAYQTPKKTSRKSPGSSKATPRRFPRPPQSPLCTPERPQRPPAEVTPAKQAGCKGSLRDSSPCGWGAPTQPKVTPQSGCSLAGGTASPLEKTTPGTPHGPGARPLGCLQNPVWPSCPSPSPEGTLGPAAPFLSAAATPVRYALRTPPRAATLGVQGQAACTGTPLNQMHPHPPVPGASQAEEPAQTWEDKSVHTPKGPGDTTLTSSPPGSPENPSLGDVPWRSPHRESVAPPAPGDLAGKGPHTAGSAAHSLSCPAPSTPPRISQNPDSDSVPPLPPSKWGKRPRRVCNPTRRFLERASEPAAAPAVAVTDGPAAAGGALEALAEASPSPQPAPQRPASSGARSGSGWPASPPPRIAGDTEPLTLLDEAEPGAHDGMEGSLSPAEGQGSSVAAAEKTYLSSRGRPPSPSTGPSSPRTPCGASDRRWCQPASQPGGLPAAVSRAPASPQTYAVELEMQASGLPKLRIKKIDPSSTSEAEPPGSGEHAAGEESSLPGPSAPRGSKFSSKPEPTYLSPPCLRPSHSTPGKGGGQTYICQCCTPTHCPTSTPSPFHTDIGVPWTPSPKHSGKTPPDPIKDWPRRKRAVGCSVGANAGRGEATLDFPGGMLMFQPEGKEPHLEFSVTRTPLLGDFELEGVCQLPEQSPPWEGMPRVEEAAWGLFGLGSRKRPLSAKEEAEGQAKRGCGPQGELQEARRSEDGPQGASAWQLPTAGDDDVFASGCTPPPSCSVGSGLSASGLQALTQSPLLLQGKAPARRGDASDEDADIFPPVAEESPLSRAFSRRRPIARTYTRKKLIS